MKYLLFISMLLLSSCFSQLNLSDNDEFHSANQAINIVKNHFPQLRNTHISVQYQRSYIGKAPIRIDRVEFYLSEKRTTQLESKGEIRGKALKLMKRFGNTELECLNIDVSSNNYKFGKIAVPLRKITLSIVCG